MTFGFPTRRRVAFIHSIRFRIKHANTVAPITHLRPIRITNILIDGTALRGTSRVRHLNLHVNSGIIVHHTNSIVPRIIGIILSRHPRSAHRIMFPARYPMYNSSIRHIRNRTITHYANNLVYKTRHGRSLGRFISHHTVSISKVNSGVVSRLIRGRCIRAPTSLFGLATNGLAKLRHVKPGSTRGIIGTLRGTGRAAFTHFLCTLNVHRINRTATTNLTTCFNALRTLRTTSVRRLRGIPSINVIITSRIRGFFTRRDGHGIVDRLLTRNIR